MFCQFLLKSIQQTPHALLHLGRSSMRSVVHIKHIETFLCIVRSILSVSMCLFSRSAFAHLAFDAVAFYSFGLKKRLGTLTII